MAYCDGRELGVFSLCLDGWRARDPDADGPVGRGCGDLPADAGRPAHLAGQPDQPALQVLGTIRGRRGEDGAWDLLDEALPTRPRAPASRRGSSRCGPPGRSCAGSTASRTSRPPKARRATTAAGHADPWTFGSLAIWLLPARRAGPGLPGLPEPYALEAGRRLARPPPRPGSGIGRPYDAALARLGSSDEAACGRRWPAFDELGATRPRPRSGSG